MLGMDPNRPHFRNELQMPAQQKTRKNVRKKLYVSHMIQGRMLLKLSLYWAVYHFVLWHAMFLYRYMQYRADVLGGATQVPFAELYATFLTQHYSLILCAIGLFPIILWDMVKVTHRIAGPLVRFQHTLRDLTTGLRVKPIKLRKGDMLVELQDIFNEYITELNAKLDRGRSRDSLADARPDREEHEIVAGLQEIRSTVGSSCGDSDVDQDPRKSSETTAANVD